jgi:putative FmdB family regulatory protein
MPTYEYQCGKCSHQFEAFQSIKAEPLTKCEKKGCRGKVKRLISAGGGVIFKGSGFYITDYRSDNYKKGEKAESSSSGKESSGTEGTTEKSDSSKKTDAAKKSDNNKESVA